MPVLEVNALGRLAFALLLALNSATHASSGVLVSKRSAKCQVNQQANGLVRVVMSRLYT